MELKNIANETHAFHEFSQIESATFQASADRSNNVTERKPECHPVVLETESNEIIPKRTASPTVFALSENSPGLSRGDTIQEEQMTDTPSHYEKASFLNILHFIFALKQICKLRKRHSSEPITMNDVPLLGTTEEVNQKILILENSYKQYRKKHSKSSLFWPIVYLFWPKLLFIQLSVILYNASKMLFTLFLSHLLQNIESGERATAYKWAGALFAVVFTGIYTNHQNFFQGSRLVGQLKPALIGLIYRKINTLSFYSINQVSIGKIVNIAANDLNSFEYSFTYIFYLIIAPFVLAGSLGLLWSLFGVHCLPGVGCVLACWPIQARFSKLIEKYTDQKNSVTDERIRLTNEMIENIRLLKIYAWDIEFKKLISSARDKEIKLLRNLSYAEYFGGHMFSKLAPAIGTFLIFISYQLNGNSLTTDRAYSAIIMLSFLRGATVYFCNVGFKFVIEARLIFTRIIQILDLDELDMEAKTPVEAPVKIKNRVEFEDFSAYWGDQSKEGSSSDSKKKKKPKAKKFKSRIFPSMAATPTEEVITDTEKPTLSKISFTVKKGTLCALIGKVGCGKSTILKAFFNEIPKVTGHLRYNGKLAYVEQEVATFPGTAKSNIIFGRPYNENRYNKVVEACCLVDDFKAFPDGDMTEIGERGVNLSGGQKARISLARAVYSDADIYLLDDPLSAVDAKVAKSLFKNVIRGILREKTVLLATHQVHFAKEAEKIVILENGKIKIEGNLADIIQYDSSLLGIFLTAKRRRTAQRAPLNIEQLIATPHAGSLGFIMNFADAEKRAEGTTKPESKASIEEIKEKPEDEDGEEDEGDEHAVVEDDLHKEDKGKLTSEEDESANRVGFQAYSYYLKSTGSIFSVAILLINLAAVETLNVLYGWFLGYWTDGDWEPNTSMIVLATIIGVLVVALVAREVIFVNVSLNASKKMHKNALKSVITAVVAFFDTNPAGRILNRFSNDIGVLDQSLVSVQNDLLDDSFYFISLLITVWIIIPWLLLPGVLLFVFYGALVRLCRRAIMEGKNLELLTRSPVYSLFSLTLSGVVSIRAYGQKNRFIRDFTNLLNRNCRAYNYYYDTARAFGFYCDFFSGIFACIGISVLLAFTNLNPAQIGLACSYLISITEYIQWAIRQILMHTMLMSSASRIKAYTHLPQEAALTLPRDKEVLAKGSWPSKGEIHFNNVYLRYRENTDHILKGLTFSVKPGEKIGCVGRTGAGKSSIIQALFRMVEIDKETAPHSSIVIDGEDTMKLGLHTLRQNISIIPQIPCVFSGSIRANLDPLKKYSDEQIIKALEETNLWEYVKKLPHGLDTDMNNSSSVFSVGQKQLICFARALLQKNKIVVLDEATANVDFETDNFIQRLIMEKFKGSTIFTIAHRLSTIANYDKVLVLDKGKVVEFDHPYLLLVRSTKDKVITNRHGVFSNMVLNTGTKHSAVILEIARASYLKKNHEKQSIILNSAIY